MSNKLTVQTNTGITAGSGAKETMVAAIYLRTRFPHNSTDTTRYPKPLTTSETEVIYGFLVISIIKFITITFSLET